MNWRTLWLLLLRMSSDGDAETAVSVDSKPRPNNPANNAVSYTHLDVYKRQPITWIEEIQTLLREREIEEDLWMDKQQ